MNVSPLFVLVLWWSGVSLGCLPLDVNCDWLKYRLALLLMLGYKWCVSAFFSARNTANLKANIWTQRLTGVGLQVTIIFSINQSIKWSIVLPKKHFKTWITSVHRRTRQTVSLQTYIQGLKNIWYFSLINHFNYNSLICFLFFCLSTISAGHTCSYNLLCFFLCYVIKARMNQVNASF